MHDFGSSPGVVTAIYNTDESIRNFAHSCFQVALAKKLPVRLATRVGSVREYDSRFKAIFDEVFEGGYHDDFSEQMLDYEHRSVQRMASQVV